MSRRHQAARPGAGAPAVPGDGDGAPTGVPGAGAAPTAADPWAALRSKQYVGLLVLAAVLGVPVSAAAYGFLALVTELQGWTYDDLPSALGFDSAPAWWPLVPLGVAGVIVGLVVRHLPGHGGEVPVEGFKAGGRAAPAQLPGIALAAVASIGLGAVVGPEGPLVALGGGLAYLMVWLRRRDLPEQAGAVVAVTGSFAAISTLLGSPLAGAFLLMEASGLGGPLAATVLVPGLLGAGIGSLIFVGLDSLTGLGVFDLAIPTLPSVGAPTVAEFGYALAIGLLAAVLCTAIRTASWRLVPLVSRAVVTATAAVGLATAGLAILYAQLTDESVSQVLFSGQDALPALVSGGATMGAGALALLLVCKGLAYVGCLAAFRGGPTFPAMFLGAAGGILLSHLPGLTLVAGVAMGIGAMTAGMLRLPLTAVLLTTLFLGADGVAVMPLVVVAVAVAFVATIRMSPPPAPVVTPPAAAT